MPVVGRAVANLLGTGLIVVGVLILVGTGALYAYGQYAQASLADQASGDLAATSAQPAAAATVAPTVVAPTTSVPTRVPTPSTTATSGPLPAVIPASTAVASSSATSAPPKATSPPVYPVKRLVAPSIGLDAGVVESPFVDGQWTIPKFEAGHLQGTAQPFTGGNVVLIGHVESITSGDVFARIGDLKVGDPIRLYTQAGIATYDVRSVRSVSNDDVSVLKSRKEDILTLITCAGSWLPLQGDYSQRTVVIAARAAH